MYEDQAPLLRFLSDCGIPIPAELKATAEVALNGLLRQALAPPELDLSAIQSLLEEIRIAQVPLDQTGLEITLRRNIEKGAERFLEDPKNLTRLVKFREMVAAARRIAVSAGVVARAKPLLRHIAASVPAHASRERRPVE